MSSLEEDIMTHLATYGLENGIPYGIDCCDHDELAEILIRTSTLTKQFDEQYMKMFDVMIKSGDIPWNVCLRSICRYTRFDNISAVKGICEYLDRYFSEIQPESFLQQESDIKDLEVALVDVFEWTIEAVQALIPLKEYWDELEDENEPCSYALATAINFVNEPFCGLFLANSPKPDFLRTLTEIDEHLRTNDHTESAQTLSDMLLRGFNNLFKTKPYVNNEYKLSHFNLRCTSFRVLTTIYSCYRVLTPVEEMASVFHVYSQILEVPFKDVVFDIIHAALLVMSEEAGDLPLLPRKLRVDFHWHVIPFLHERIAKILNVLINKYGYPIEDVYAALDEVLDRLRMTLDIVDLNWKCCAFQWIIESTYDARFPGADVAELLVEKRVQQQKENPEFEKLSKLDTADDIMHLYELAKMTIKEFHDTSMGGKPVMTRSKLAKKLFSLVEDSSFSTIISALCGQEKLLEFSHLLAMMNTESQEIGGDYPDRLQTFDFSFLLLSWMAIKYPNISLKVIVNGTNFGSEAETKGIFYQWARRYMKYVRELKFVPTKKNDDANKDVKVETEEGAAKESDQKTNEDTSENNSPAKEEPKDDGAEGSEDPQKAEEDKQIDEIEGGLAKAGILEDEEIEGSKIPEPIPPLDTPSKEQAMVYLQKLREQQPFWNTNDPELNVVELICAIPPIGEVLLESFEPKKIDKGEGVKLISDMLFVLEELSCLFVCLVQWLDSQPDTPARRSLGFAMLEALRIRMTDQTRKWLFIESMLEQTLSEIKDREPVNPENACFAFSTTRRFCPRIGRSEYPDGVQLRSSWYYMSQQAWSGPHALKLVENTNTAGLYTTWCDVFINRTVSFRCGDVMKKNLDMIFAMVMLDQYNSIIRIHESLIDYWFSDSVGGIQDARFDPISVMPVVRITTHIMMLAAWSVQELRKKIPDSEPSAKKSTFETPIAVPDIDDIDTPAKWEYLLDSMLTVTVNRFRKTYRKGVMSPVLSTICHLIRAIAGAPDSEPKRLLIQRFPPEMMAEIAYIDGSALSYEVMKMFCDPTNKEHSFQKLRFLCAARKNCAM